MTLNNFRMGMLIATFAVVLTTFAAACGSSAPEAVEIPVSVMGKTMNPGTIRVKKGNMVTLKIDAEEDGEFHLHGYDIEQEIDGDEIANFYFIADATGRFKITFHHSEESDDGKGGEEFDIGFLEVSPR